MNAQRLYMAVWVTDDEGDAVVDTDTMPWVSAGRHELEPAGWREYALDMFGTVPAVGEVWPNGHKPFFWPKTGVPYMSRSSAQRRVDIINRWGGKAVLLECTPEWVTVADANASRERRRIHDRITKLQDALQVERAKFEAVAS